MRLGERNIKEIQCTRHTLGDHGIQRIGFGIKSGHGRGHNGAHLGDGRAYLCGCERDGRLAAFDVGSGRVSAMDPGDLPRASRWRVMVPEGNGVVTVYAAEPA